MAGAIAGRFKKEDSLKGRISKEIIIYLANEIDACNDLNASDDRRLKYLHIFFDKEAKRLYRSFVFR